MSILSFDRIKSVFVLVFLIGINSFITLAQKELNPTINLQNGFYSAVSFNSTESIWNDNAVLIGGSSWSPEVIVGYGFKDHFSLETAIIYQAYKVMSNYSSSIKYGNFGSERVISTTQIPLRIECMFHIIPHTSLSFSLGYRLGINNSAGDPNNARFKHTNIDLVSGTIREGYITRTGGKFFHLYEGEVGWNIMMNKVHSITLLYRYALGFKKIAYLDYSYRKFGAFSDVDRKLEYHTNGSFSSLGFMYRISIGDLW